MKVVFKVFSTPPLQLLEVRQILPSTQPNKLMIILSSILIQRKSYPPQFALAF